MKSYIILLALAHLGCTTKSSTSKESSTFIPASYVTCTDSSCTGNYSGPEFVNGDDVAHQFSNKMAAKAGDKLKELYQNGDYVSVDLENIIMTTIGMDGKGDVEYSLAIPFKKVNDSCDAHTSLDHRGGWGHTPKLENVLEKFKSVNGLEYKFHSTPEGLTEYWLQWKNIDFQSNCL